MTQKTHITFGLALAVGVNAIADFTGLSSYILDAAKEYVNLEHKDSLIQSTSIFLYLWAALSALMPDLDHAKAALGREFGFKTIGKIIRFLVSDRHRGPTHTIEFALVYAAIVGGITFLLTGSWMWFVIYASFIGYFSHILIDMLNNRGVRLTLVNFKGYLSLIPENMTAFFRVFYTLLYGFLFYMMLTGSEVPDLFTYLNIDLEPFNLSNMIFSSVLALLTFFYKGVTTSSDQENKIVFPIITLLVVVLTVTIWEPLYERMNQFDSQLIKDYPIVWIISLVVILFIFSMTRKKLNRMKALSLWLIISFSAWTWVTVIGWNELWDYYTEKGKQGIEIIKDVKDDF
ncbi:MAG: hypothetical protein IEMM0008_0011 [bacterium]|nr:MAG: hypothetical protein IEMM0008_0011 [bacterium]